MATSRQTADILELRLVLLGVNPLIWRRLLVRADANVADLHVANRSLRPVWVDAAAQRGGWSGLIRIDDAVAVGIRREREHVGRDGAIAVVAVSSRTNQCGVAVERRKSPSPARSFACSVQVSPRHAKRLSAYLETNSRIS